MYNNIFYFLRILSLTDVVVILTVSRVTVKRYLPSYSTPKRAQHVQDNSFNGNVSTNTQSTCTKSVYYLSATTTADLIDSIE